MHDEMRNEDSTPTMGDDRYESDMPYMGASAPKRFMAAPAKAAPRLLPAPAGGIFAKKITIPGLGVQVPLVALLALAGVAFWQRKKLMRLYK